LFFNEIKKKYNAKIERYYLRPAPSNNPLEKYIQPIPFGFVFNIILSTSLKKSPENNARFYDEAIELAKHYIYCTQNLSLNPYSNMVQDHNTIIKSLQKTVFVDQQYTIEQISHKHFKKIFNSLLLNSNYDIVISSYYNIYKFLLTKASYCDCFEFTEADLVSHLKNVPLSDTPSNLLSVLSLDISEVNQGYLYPDDIIKRNYYQKPIIKTGNKYLFINRNFTLYGFYLLTQKHLINNIKQNNIGSYFEKCLLQELEAKGIQVLANKKYRISKVSAEEISSKSQEGECDYILETDDTIIFIELKQKTLTSESRSGFEIKTLTDLASSFLHPLTQATKHEYFLIRDGRINFTDGTTINLNNRKIEKIALTAFGFYGL